MTDAELPAAIAEAVRGVWADTIDRDLATLGFRHGKWVLWDGISDSSTIPPLWVAAILLHELERKTIGWTMSDLIEPTAEQAAVFNSIDRMKDLLKGNDQ